MLVKGLVCRDGLGERKTYGFHGGHGLLVLDAHVGLSIYTPWVGERTVHCVCDGFV
jgi:hypothetical protein